MGYSWFWEDIHVQQEQTKTDHDKTSGGGSGHDMNGYIAIFRSDRSQDAIQTQLNMRNELQYFQNADKTNTSSQRTGKDVLCFRVDG